MHFLKSTPLLLSLITFSSLSAQVVINEYSCSNLNTVTDNYGKYEDWIELYNKGGSAVNLTGYYLSDDKLKPKKWTIPSGISIPANGMVRFWASGNNIVVGTDYHTNFKLTQTKPEMIIFSNGAGVIQDSITLKPTQDDHSRGRTTDGAATWSLFTTPTPLSPNTGAMLEYAARPTMSVAPGFYTSAQTVSLACSTTGCDIYYTTDGAIPTTGSTKYTGPINVSTTTVIRARAFHPTNTQIPAGFMETNTYFINVNHTITVISVASDKYDDLFNNVNALVFSSIEYFDKNKNFIFEVDGGEADPHGNDSWAYPQKGFDVVLKDQHGYNYAINYKLYTAKPRTEFDRMMFKAGASDNYPFGGGPGCHLRDAFVQSLAQKEGLEVDERTYEPCIVYINGVYWGVYEYREKVNDHHFTEYYYNQGENDIDVLAYWGGMNINYGSDTGWVNVYNFCMANNLAVQANYDHVAKFLNMNSVIDNAIFNTFIVNSDWINWNTMWWRGNNPNGNKKKWRYALWDCDNVFDLGQNYSGWNTTTFNADPCDIQQKFQNAGSDEGHMDILTQCLKNAQFKNKYVNRYFELINGPLSCPNVLNHLNGILAVLTPEMPGQIAKWGGSMTGWQNNVTYLKTQINGRCSVITNAMKNCYKVTGPYNIVIDAEPRTGGKIFFNYEELTPLAWSASYFGGITNTLEAVPNPGYTFEYWEVGASSITPDTKTAKVSLKFTGNDNIIAHFKAENGEHIPSAFSPNGDGINDVLMFLATKNIVKMDLVIYNRWGQAVFETKDPGIGWDGTVNGQLQNSGVYAYKLVYTLADETEHLENGNITLFR